MAGRAIWKGELKIRFGEDSGEIVFSGDRSHRAFSHSGRETLDASQTAHGKPRLRRRGQR